jgi:hypothetical protein
MGKENERTDSKIMRIRLTLHTLHYLGNLESIISKYHTVMENIN